jgi:ankyrin repeat protein
LHYAAGEDESGAAVRRLIKAGEKVAQADRSGWTPLHFAAAANQVENIEALLASGAPVDVTDKDGNTPLFRAVFAYQGNGDAIRLLREAGADPNLLNRHGQSPVGLARLIASIDVAKHFADLP